MVLMLERPLSPWPFSVNIVLPLLGFNSVAPKFFDQRLDPHFYRFPLASIEVMSLLFRGMRMLPIAATQ